VGEKCKQALWKSVRGGAGWKKKQMLVPPREEDEEEEAQVPSLMPLQGSGDRETYQHMVVSGAGEMCSYAAAVDV
jgi:hypothetical protein